MPRTVIVMAGKQGEAYLVPFVSECDRIKLAVEGDESEVAAREIGIDRIVDWGIVVTLRGIVQDPDRKGSKSPPHDLRSNSMYHAL